MTLTLATGDTFTELDTEPQPTRPIVDGGDAATPPDSICDGGDAATPPDTILDAGGA